MNRPTQWIAATLLVGLGWSSPALAGSGPWVIGDGEYSLYIGGESQRLERLQYVDAEGNRTVIDVDDGLSTVGAKAILTLGAQGRFEGELTLPFQRVQANRIGDVCESLGPSACATTQGLGVITARGKGTVLDELYGDPITWAVGVDLRFGQFTAAQRSRITNLGEGTFDTGVLTSIGRGAPLGEEGYFSAYLEAVAWYRFPNTRRFPGPNGEISAPNPEGALTSQVLLGWRPWFSFGPDVTAYARPGGLDFGATNLADPDRLGSLRVFNLRVGGTLIIRAREKLAFSASASHTVSATNNPYVTSFSLGVGTNGRVTGRR